MSTQAVKLKEAKTIGGTTLPLSFDGKGAQRRRRQGGDRRHRRPADGSGNRKLKTITIPIAEAEFDQLRAFLSAHAKLEGRKMEIAKDRNAAIADQKSLARLLEHNLFRLKPIEQKHTEAKEELIRLKNPPTLAPLEAYFFTEDVSTKLRQAYPNVSPDLIKTINGLHRELSTSFKYTKTAPARLRALKIYIYNLQNAQKTIDKEIDKTRGKLAQHARNLVPAGGGGNPAKEFTRDQPPSHII
ncbi:MAG: hypothetical protein HC806_01550 [Anaerolineae bacterium]|nr:hypothetical protein [Anaerolineae bacterium]